MDSQTPRCQRDGFSSVLVFTWLLVPLFSCAWDLLCRQLLVRTMEDLLVVTVANKFHDRCLVTVVSIITVLAVLRLQPPVSAQTMLLGGIPPLTYK